MVISILSATLIECVKKKMSNVVLSEWKGRETPVWYDNDVHARNDFAGFSLGVQI